jgi:hypothetical protein
MDPSHTADPARERNLALEALLARFAWPIEEEFMCEAFEVVSDHSRKAHTVRWPRESSGLEPPFPRYLHEMGHALLGEQVHPQFASPAFALGQDQALINTYRSLFEAVLDWFVQALLMEVAPAFQGPDIDARFRQTTDMLRRGMALPSVEFVVDSGLNLASFSLHRSLDVETKGKLLDVMNAFLRIDPNAPNLFALHGLVKSLMKTFELHTASLVRERGFEHWRILPVVKRA